jgi:nucleoside-diphosphate-sugar epimerase
MYIDDCVRATQTVVNGESTKPANVGSAELISIDDLVRTPPEFSENPAELASQLPISLSRENVTFCGLPSEHRSRITSRTRSRRALGW